jgi:hypothetical protein
MQNTRVLELLQGSLHTWEEEANTARKKEKPQRLTTTRKEKRSMQILVNRDEHIVLHRKLSNFLDTEINRIVDRFNLTLTRVEVHLSDEHAFKAVHEQDGVRSKRGPKSNSRFPSQQILPTCWLR